MNRRQFTTRFTALGLAPLLPSMSTAKATASLSGAAAAQYPWAVQYARVYGSCSRQALANALHIAPDLAGELVMKLQLEGVVSAPGLTGIAHAVNPINWHVQRSAAAQTTAASSGKTLKKRIKEFLPASSEASPHEPDKQPLTEARKTESTQTPTTPLSGSAERPPA